MADPIEPTGGTTQFEELPDAPPRRKLKLSWPGKTGVGVVIFWLLIVFIGPSISPYHEATSWTRSSSSFRAAIPIPQPTSSPRARWRGSAPTTSGATPSPGRCSGRAPPSASRLPRPCSLPRGSDARYCRGGRGDGAGFGAEPAQRRHPLDPQHHARAGHDRRHRQHDSHPDHVDRTHLRIERVPDRACARSGRHGQRLRRGGPGARRGTVVDHHPRDPAQRGHADGHRLRAAVRLHHPVHLEPELPRASGCSRRSRTGAAW